MRHSKIIGRPHRRDENASCQVTIIPAPKTGNWKSSYGNWEGFCKVVHRSIGKKIGNGVMTYCEAWDRPAKKPCAERKVGSGNHGNRRKRACPDSKISRDAFLNFEISILLTDAAPRNVRVVNGIPVLFDAIAERASEQVVEWASCNAL